MKRIILLVLFFAGLLYIASCNKEETAKNDKTLDSAITVYDTNSIPKGPERDAITYGMNLFMNTHKYLGTKGTVMKVSTNDVDCKNCHLNGGTKPNALPLFTVVSRYPNFRAREGRILNIQDRVNNCFVNPLLGHEIDVKSKEMYAITMYLKWLWDSNGNKMKLAGDIPVSIPWLERAADLKKGEVVYVKYCARCHQPNGEGVPNPTDGGYVYPPVWGMKSFSLGSSMHRIGKMAAYIKYNMPNDKHLTNEQLTDEEAFDVAAYVNYEKIHPRPPYNAEEDFYKDPKLKTIDFPLAPYADPFTEEQHRWGPFKPIEEWRKKNK